MEIERLYFFTASIFRWNKIFEFLPAKQIIIDSLHFLTSENRVKICAFVIMPDHIHLIWQPTSPNLQLQFMKYTAQRIRFFLIDHKPRELQKFDVGKSDRQYQIWQRNSLAVELFSREVVEQKLDYLHANPISSKYNLVSDPADYNYSSARFYLLDVDQFGFLTHYMDVIG